jgi:hypothetical protein
MASLLSASIFGLAVIVDACSLLIPFGEKTLASTGEGNLHARAWCDENGLEVPGRVGDTQIRSALATSVDTQTCRSVGTLSIRLDATARAYCEPRQEPIVLNGDVNYA